MRGRNLDVGYLPEGKEGVAPEGTRPTNELILEEAIEFAVERGGIRLDKYLAERLGHLSRSTIQRLIEAGNVRVNGRSSIASHKTRVGERVNIRIPPTEPSPLLPQAIELQVLYDDSDLLVLDKPAGLVVHPAAGHADGTLVNALLYHAPDISVGGTQRPGIVHRLDRDTSGVILVAKNDAALENLQRQFHSRTVAKTYLALVQGQIESVRGKIDTPIGRDPRNRKKMAVTGSRSRRAETEFSVKLNLGSFQLLELHPKTGRTHQLRVHLAFIGHPVIGDRVYGKTKSGLNVSRQLLHAWKISFDHPRTGERRTFIAPLPRDFRQVLSDLGADPNQLDP